ncbi:hypothetical protein Ae707Ps1_5984 [Pseudonocardia sp. Ae707_Ps1]|nr:hypothetical protein Ae707Ps1_5984 [Pseudonocardia sp. Ae707_Ps1]
MADVEQAVADVEQLILTEDTSSGTHDTGKEVEDGGDQIGGGAGRGESPLSPPGDWRPGAGPSRVDPCTPTGAANAAAVAVR